MKNMRVSLGIILFIASGIMMNIDWKTGENLAVLCFWFSIILFVTAFVRKMRSHYNASTCKPFDIMALRIGIAVLTAGLVLEGFFPEVLVTLAGVFNLVGVLLTAIALLRFLWPKKKAIMAMAKKDAEDTGALYFFKNSYSGSIAVYPDRVVFVSYPLFFAGILGYNEKTVYYSECEAITHECFPMEPLEWYLSFKLSKEAFIRLREPIIIFSYSLGRDDVRMIPEIVKYVTNKVPPVTPDGKET